MPMGERGELFSIKTFAQNGRRTYFFNIKENRFGDRYLAIVESLKKEFGGFERRQIAVFNADIPFFQHIFDKGAALAEKNESEWSETLESDNGSRLYVFALRREKRYMRYYVSEEKPDEELNGMRRIVIEKEDIVRFQKGLSKALAYVKTEAKANKGSVVKRFKLKAAAVKKEPDSDPDESL